MSFVKEHHQIKINKSSGSGNLAVKEKAVKDFPQLDKSYSSLQEPVEIPSPF